MKLRVASYNIRNGVEVAWDFRIIANDILSNKVDIVGFQEVDENTSRNQYKDTVALLSEYTGYYRYFSKTIDYKGGEYGIALLSRFPIEKAETILLESDAEQRALQVSVINIDNERINFLNTHLTHTSKETRMKEFAYIGSLVNQNDFILTGDFNTSDFSEFTVLNGILSNSDLNYMPSFIDSSSAIDNIVLSKDWKLLKTEMQKERHSDHHMIISEIEK